MAKKNKLKRLRKSYNKKQFESILCSGCRVCTEYATGPEFCYNLYKENADLFLKKVYKKLITIDEWPWTIKTPIQEMSNALFERAAFKNIYCDSGICAPIHEKECPLFQDCLIEFRKQTGRWGNPSLQAVAGGPTISEKKSKKQLRREKRAATKAAKRKQKYICSAYPTFFTNSREGWIAQVEEILTNGDTNIEQVETTESS